jgi:PAS domain S-box-containing protein
MCSSHESVFTKMTGENLAIALAESFAEKNSKLAELRVIVEACPLATFISDSNGRCVYVNQAYQELIGRPYRACLDMHWKSFIHLDDLGDALRAWARAVKTSGVYDYEYRIVRPGGETIPVHVRAQPLPSGGFVGYINATNGTNCNFMCAAKVQAALAAA